MSDPDRSKQDQTEAADQAAESAGNPARALVGLLALVLLIGAVVLIMYHLHQAAVIQDCVSAGRSNCAPIPTSVRN